MILSSTRCALIACRYLVQGYNERGYVPATEVAEHYNMNARALMPALRRMVKCGLLYSRRGNTDAGFMFARHPEQINLWDIVSVLEGDLTFPCCKEVLGDITCDCGRNSSCKINSILNDGFAQIKKELRQTNLSKFAES